MFVVIYSDMSKTAVNSYAESFRYGTCYVKLVVQLRSSLECRIRSRSLGTTTKRHHLIRRLPN